MATKSEAAPADAAPVKPPVKSKKKLIIIVGVVLLLLLGGGGAVLYVKKQRAAAAAAEDGTQEPATPAGHAAAKTPPVYLPMDNMVVNLADPGGERVAQVGVTLEVTDDRAATMVKAFMPTIRSGVLMLLAQRTAEQLLSPEGKQKLIEDILRETSKPFGGGEVTDPAKKPHKKVAVEYPVTGVLFSSLIVQ